MVACNSGSVTRWVDYFSIFGHLQKWQFGKWHTKFFKVGSKVCQMLNYLLNNCQKLLRFSRSGETSPNLVTLNSGRGNRARYSTNVEKSVHLFYEYVALTQIDHRYTQHVHLYPHT